MTALTGLALASAVGVALLFIVLAAFLVAISRELEEIGGPATRFVTPTNYLSKIRFGVRAIERQTDALVPLVTRLNLGLAAVRDALRSLAAELEGLAAALARQGRR